MMNKDEFQKYAAQQWEAQDREVLLEHFQAELAVSLERSREAGMPATDEHVAVMNELGENYLRLLAMQGHMRIQARGDAAGNKAIADETPIATNLNLRFTLLNQRGEKELPPALFGKVVRASMEAVRKGFAELYHEEHLGLRILHQFTVGEAVDRERPLGAGRY